MGRGKSTKNEEEEAAKVNYYSRPSAVDERKRRKSLFSVDDRKNSSQ